MGSVGGLSDIITDPEQLRNIAGASSKHLQNGGAGMTEAIKLNHVWYLKGCILQSCCVEALSCTSYFHLEGSTHSDGAVGIGSTEAG